MGSYFPFEAHVNENRNKNYKNRSTCYSEFTGSAASVWFIMIFFSNKVGMTWLTSHYRQIIQKGERAKLTRYTVTGHSICTRKIFKINRWSVHQGQNVLVTLDSILIYESLIKKIISHYDEKLKTKNKELVILKKKLFRVTQFEDTCRPHLH